MRRDKNGKSNDKEETLKFLKDKIQSQILSGGKSE